MKNPAILLLGLVAAGGAYLFNKNAHAASSLPDLSGNPIDLKISDAYYDKAVSALKGQRGNELAVLSNQVKNSLGGKQSLYSMLTSTVSYQIQQQRLAGLKAGEPGGSPALTSAVNMLLKGAGHPGVLVTWKAALLRAKLPGAAAALEAAAARLRLQALPGNPAASVLRGLDNKTVSADSVLRLIAQMKANGNTTAAADLISVARAAGLSLGYPDPSKGL